jgi:hypothetical protein
VSQTNTQDVSAVTTEAENATKVAPEAVESIKTAAAEAVTPEATVLEPDEETEEGDENGDDENGDTEDAVAAGEETKAGENEDDGVLRIPENEFAFLQEILKNPIGNNQYEISKEAPLMAFKGRGSPKTLAQTAKNKLIERNIIKSIQQGGAQRRAIVELLIENVEMNKDHRGRKSNTATPSKTGRRPGRPKGSTSAARTETAARNEESSSTPGRRPGRQSTLKGAFAELRGPDYEDLNEFERELDRFAEKYPNTFKKFVTVLKRTQAA